MGSVSPAVAVAACVAVASVACAAAYLAKDAAPSDQGTATASAQADIGWVDATRLAHQATFGANVETVNEIVSLGRDRWLDRQFSARTSTYADLAARAVPRNYCAGMIGTDGASCNRDYFSATYPAMRFYANAVDGQDQLRQRVALALNQTIVASTVSVPSTAGLATFQQIFLDNAFGSYRDILSSVTLNPFMGGYLSMADSNRTAPNENYARELMQLFSMGVNLLNTDGTLQRDAGGAPIPSYTSSDVKEIARALTGWTYTRLSGAAALDGNALDYSKPMTPIASRYDTGAKVFLGRTVPAGTSQQQSVAAVVDAVFSHPNTAPHVSKALIKHLVTSNPSPAYVARVSRVFSNTQGDLKAVVRAVLTDEEARDGLYLAGAGKVKEPVLYLTGLARLLPQNTDGYVFTLREAQLGQSIFRSPSVFNFYPPDYPLPFSDGLESGPSKLMTTSGVLARHNLAYDWTVSGDQAFRGEYNPAAGITGATGTQVDWGGWESLDVDATIDRINLLMLHNAMSANQRVAMKSAMLAITNRDAVVQARRRAQVALYIAATSPLYQVDR